MLPFISFISFHRCRCQFISNKASHLQCSVFYFKSMLMAKNPRWVNGSWVNGSWVTSPMGHMGHGSQKVTHCQLCGESNNNYYCLVFNTPCHWCLRILEQNMANDHSLSLVHNSGTHSILIPEIIRFTNCSSQAGIMILQYCSSSYALSLDFTWNSFLLF